MPKKKAGDERLPDNARLLPLPPYSPELNPVEHVGSLIRSATANRVFPTLEAMAQAIEEKLRPWWTVPERVRSQANASSKSLTDPFLTSDGVRS